MKTEVPFIEYINFTFHLHAVFWLKIIPGGRPGLAWTKSISVQAGAELGMVHWITAVVTDKCKVGQIQETVRVNY